MKYFIILINLFISTLVFAGPGTGHSHSHSHALKAISKEKTITIGRTHIDRLVKAGKINDSWTNSIHDKSEKKTFNKKKEWVITFVNDKGVKGKKLFIFLSLSGDFIAANFSGK